MSSHIRWITGGRKQAGPLGSQHKDVEAGEEFWWDDTQLNRYVQDVDFEVIDDAPNPKKAIDAKAAEKRRAQSVMRSSEPAEEKPQKARKPRRKAVRADTSKG